MSLSATQAKRLQPLLYKLGAARCEIICRGENRYQITSVWESEYGSSTVIYADPDDIEIFEANIRADERKQKIIAEFAAAGIELNYADANSAGLTIVPTDDSYVLAVAFVSACQSLKNIKVRHADGKHVIQAYWA